MKKYFALLLIISISCNNKESQTTEVIADKVPVPIEHSENNDSIETDNVILEEDILPMNEKQFSQNFELFRKAVSEANKQKVAAYIEFPIRGEATGERVNISYTDDDYPIKFDEMFPEKFRKIISEIDVEMLLKDKKIETTTITDGEEFYYSCTASISEDNKRLVFYIPTYQRKSINKISIKDDELFSNMIYEFIISNNAIVLTGIEVNG